jgi:hypothetical protein
VNVFVVNATHYTVIINAHPVSTKEEKKYLETTLVRAMLAG